MSGKNKIDVVFFYSCWMLETRWMEKNVSEIATWMVDSHSSAIAWRTSTVYFLFDFCYFFFESHWISICLIYFWKQLNTFNRSLFDFSFFSLLVCRFSYHTNLNEMKIFCTAIVSSHKVLHFSCVCMSIEHANGSECAITLLSDVHIVREQRTSILIHRSPFYFFTFRRLKSKVSNRIFFSHKDVRFWSIDDLTIVLNNHRKKNPFLLLRKRKIVA